MWVFLINFKKNCINLLKKNLGKPIPFLFQITVTPLSALSPAEADCHAYLEDWLSSVSEIPSASAL